MRLNIEAGLSVFLGLITKTVQDVIYSKDPH